LILAWLIFAIVFAVGLAAWWAGSYDARWRARYEQELAAREELLAGMIADSSGLFREQCEERIVPGIVVGESALSARYFGNLLPDRTHASPGTRYTLLSQLARREAVIRMLEAARRAGYNAVCDVKIEAADMGSAINANQRAMVLITAIGTAYRLR